MTAIDQTIKATLAEANAAPLASDEERKGFLRVALLWLAAGLGVLAAGLAIGFAIHHFADQYQAHKAKVAAIHAAPVILPSVAVAENPVTPQKSAKSATNKIATQAINTPAMASFEAVKPIKKESSADDPLASALAEFDKQVINLESKL